MSFTVPDAPPLVLLREYIPEMADDLETMHEAQVAARTARARGGRRRWTRSLRRAGLGSGNQVGADLAVARAADMEWTAARRRERPHCLACRGFRLGKHRRRAQRALVAIDGALESAVCCALADHRSMAVGATAETDNGHALRTATL